MTSLRYFYIALVIITTAVVGCSVAQQQFQQNIYFLSQHCDSINFDITRPEYRTCYDPISLKDNIFIFVNKGGETEQYLVIEDSEGNFVYTFVDYLEE